MTSLGKLYLNSKVNVTEDRMNLAGIPMYSNATVNSDRYIAIPVGLTYVICVADGLFPTGDSISADSFIGEVKIVALRTSSIPSNWIPCDGRSLNTFEYQALYALLGNTYGGNSAAFNIPKISF
jgi:hypothetical protein